MTSVPRRGRLLCESAAAARRTPGSIVSNAGVYSRGALNSVAHRTFFAFVAQRAVYEEAGRNGARSGRRELSYMQSARSVNR